MTSDKFKGCLVGGLVGDCLGSPFENSFAVTPEKVNEFFTSVQKSRSGGQLDYTDDTAMAFNILDSLYGSDGFDALDMAKRFAGTYFNEKHRYYGNSVEVFRAWKHSDFEDLYQPAQKQFEGRGSSGNGGAMRIAPIALYCYGDQKKMAKMVTMITELTHANPLGIIGALIQCYAVRLALDEDSSQPFDGDNFVEKLRAKVLVFETRAGLNKGFSKQLSYLKEMMKTEKVVVKDVVKVFGNGETAPRSVVTALYCFVRGLQPVDFLLAENPFERVLQLAVSMGGDTDTIACMAGAIAGSYFGFKGIPAYLQRRCEGLDKSFHLSTWLHGRLSTADKEYDVRCGRMKMSLDKFKGCLVGGLIGDCLGCPFESNWVIAPKHVNDFFNILQTSDSEDQLNYTDDTAMAFNILDSLYETEYYNSKDMATRFVDTYYKERHRGYGCNVIEIFSSWKTDGVDEVYQPAQKQFEGSGSCGNGGAMRVAPVALYGYKNQKETVKLAMLTTQLTHVHPFGIVGALIQCFAVRFALDEDPSVPLDVDKFVEKLRIRVVALETKSGLKKVYSKQLEYLKDYVKMKKVTVKDVVKVFGNSVIAQRSVVTALYCFLRGLYPVDFLSATNPFERVIQLAIAVGGDTDTIACMAGSIAGGYLGFNRIPVYLQRRCEGLDKCFLYSAWLHERLATSGLKAMRYT